MAFSFVNVEEFSFTKALCEESIGRRIIWRLSGCPQGTADFLAAARQAPPDTLQQAFDQADPRHGATYLGGIRLDGEELISGPVELLSAELKNGSLHVEVTETLLADRDLSPRWEVRPAANAEACAVLGKGRMPVDVSLAGDVLGSVSEAFQKRWGSARKSFPVLLQPGISDLAYLHELGNRLGRAGCSAKNPSTGGFLVGGRGRRVVLAFPFSTKAKLDEKTAEAMGLSLAGVDRLTGFETDLGPAPAALRPTCDIWERSGQHEIRAAFLADRPLLLPFRLETANGAKRVVIARRWVADAHLDTWRHQWWACTQPGAWAYPPQPREGAASHALQVVVKSVDLARWTVRCLPADERFDSSSAPFELALSTSFAGANRRQGVHMPPVEKDHGIMLWSGDLLEFPVLIGPLRPVESPEGQGDAVDVRRLGNTAMEVAGTTQSFTEKGWRMKTPDAKVEAGNGTVELKSGPRKVSISQQFVDVS